MPDRLNVFLSSTSDDLADRRLAVREVILDLGWHPVAMEHFGADSRPTVQALKALIDGSQLFLLVQAYRRGWVPTEAEGGDGESSITAIEYRYADTRKVPRLVFQSRTSWPGNLWEDDQAARQWVNGFRDSTNQFASFFEHEDQPLAAFKALVRQVLVTHKERVLAQSAPVRQPAEAPRTVSLRPLPDLGGLPDRPYPLLGPYEHPRTFGGRDSELEELCALVRRDLLVLCVHAPSGAGKSSLLLAGLAPELRADGYAVAVERHPEEPGLARGLTAQLLSPREVVAVDDENPTEFAAWIDRARTLSETDRLYRPEWREVLLLLAGVLHQHDTKTLDVFVRAVLDSVPGDGPMAQQASIAGLLGSMFRDLAAVHYTPHDLRYDALLENVQGVFTTLGSHEISVETRIEAADALAQAGDPRLDASHPDYWVTIPGGTFWMGAQKTNPKARRHDPEADDDESPVHEVMLETFRISRNLVTVAEFERFVESDGYTDQQHWQAGGWSRFERPKEWDEQLRFPGRPVVGVSWFEASAYCAWAGVRLPSEAEWERAARLPRQAQSPGPGRLRGISCGGVPHSLSSLWISVLCFL